MKRRTASHLRRRGFTLIELLCVMAIIAILVSLAMPAYSGFREKSDGIKCASNLRQIGVAVHGLVAENDGAFPEIETDPNNPVYPADSQAKGLLATLTRNGFPEQQKFLEDLRKNPQTATLSGNGFSADVVKCPADLRSFKYYVQRGTSYEWAPYVDDELETSVQVFGRRGQMTMPLSKIIMCFDTERVHGLKDNVWSNKNYLYADGHVRNYSDTAPRAKPKN